MHSHHIRVMRQRLTAIATRSDLECVGPREGVVGKRRLPGKLPQPRLANGTLVTGSGSVVQGNGGWVITGPAPNYFYRKVFPDFLRALPSIDSAVAGFAAKSRVIGLSDRNDHGRYRWIGKRWRLQQVSMAI
jgi:hypothetical protein